MNCSNWLRPLAFKYYILILHCFLTIVPVAEAAMIPRLSVVAMCEKADAVIDCTHVGDGKFNVKQIYKLSAGPAIGQVVHVPYFSDHSPVLWSFRRSPESEKPLLVDHALLFLQYSKANEWIPLGRYSRGAQGVVWIGKEKCYWYVQKSNPGGLGLELRKEASSFHRASILNEDPFKEVEVGVVDSLTWRDTLAEENPIKRTEALARYLMRRTSPARDFSHYAELAQHRLKSESLHGPPAVVDAIKHANAKDRLDYCVGALTGSFWRMRVQGYHRMLEYSVDTLVPLIGDTNRVDQNQLIFGLGGCARPEPLDKLREIAASANDNARLASGVAMRIEEDLQKAETSTSKPTEDWAIEQWEVYVNREREWARDKR